MRLDRRTFLKASAAGTAGASVIGRLLGLPNPVARALQEAETAQAAEEKRVRTVCRQCPGACGLEVRVVGGRAVKIEGNPDHPINYGRICPKGQSGLHVLYDPDRIKGPLKRTNPEKGLDRDPGFVSVSWEEALDDIAGRLRKLRAEGRSHTVGIQGGRYRGHSHFMTEVFLELYGSPNDLGHSSLCSDASVVAHGVTDGFKAYQGYDWDNTNYVISFGGSFLEAFRPTTRLLRAWGHLRRGRPVRAKFVSVDTRMSVTAAKADEWLAVRSGTDAALALGMAHVILTEGLWDRGFVGDFKAAGGRFESGKPIDPASFSERWTTGLADWWNEVVKDMTPERAAEISGVPAETIRRIAVEFATTPPAVATGERGAGAHTNGVYNRMAVHALNALVGSMYAKGGVRRQVGTPFAEDLLPNPKDYMDEVARGVEERVKSGELLRIDRAKSKDFPLAGNLYQNIADNHLKGDPYKLSMLIVYATNPLWSPMSPQRFEEAYKDVFIVETTSYMSETARYADYILPDPCYLETYLDNPVYPSLGFPCAGIHQPVVKPLYDSMPWGDVVIELGKRLGGRMAEYYHAIGSWENLLKTLAKGLPITWEEWLAKGVWYDPHYPWEYRDGKFYENGVEMTPSQVKEKVLTTPSGRFEFRSKTLEEKGFNPYPHYEEPKRAGGPGFDLHLVSPKMITHAEGRGANQPWLQESFAVHVKEGWDNPMEINPKTAAARGIRDGDMVWVESPVGKLKVRAKVHPGCPPDVVVIPYERGHKAYGRWATAPNTGVHPNVIMANLSDPVSGQHAYNDTMVKVYKG